jgi:hypothetical protein
MQADREFSNSAQMSRALTLRENHGRARYIRSRLDRSRLSRTFARMCFGTILRVLYKLQHTATRKSCSASLYLLMLCVVCMEDQYQWR